MKKYNKPPHFVGNFPCDVSETFSYLYMPIKLRGEATVFYEARLNVFDKIIGAALCDFVGEYGLDRFIDSNVYITAKNLYQREGSGFNRAGWHTDGFGTDDISYIWSNKQPTIFNSGSFSLTDDDESSMVEMSEQAKEENNLSLPNNSLLRLDQFSVHKVGEVEAGMRSFVKICVSKDKYNLVGNSKNQLLDYNWEYKQRKTNRNKPQE